MAFYTNHISHQDTSLFSRISGVVKAEFVALEARFARARRARRTLSELQGLSDRDLADIGLSRSSLKRAAIDAARTRG